MTCDDVRDQAAGFVLGALTPAEERAVRDHLASCPEAHEEFAELGGVVPALAASVEQVEPRPALRERIMAAAAADLRARGLETAPAAEAGAAAPPTVAPRRARGAGRHAVPAGDPGTPAPVRLGARHRRGPRHRRARRLERAASDPS